MRYSFKASNQDRLLERNYYHWLAQQYAFSHQRGAIVDPTGASTSISAAVLVVEVSGDESRNRNEPSLPMYPHHDGEARARVYSSGTGDVHVQALKLVLLERLMRDIDLR